MLTLLHIILIIVAVTYIMNRFDKSDERARRVQSSLNVIQLQATAIDRECAKLGPIPDWEPMYDDLGKRIKKPSAFRKATQQELAYSRQWRTR